jgi:sugar/nucleoside kinase (ribokinase family)
MTSDDPFALSSPGTSNVLGTGLIALDIVIAAGAGAPVGAWAGGTCGNVLTALAYLGWDAYPFARLGDVPTARLVCEDMGRWGVHLDHVTTDAEGSTPVIIQQIRRSPSGEVVHSFSCRCPLCGSHLPGYRPVRASTMAQLLPQLSPVKVFFFDRTSRGALQLARHCAEHGGLVVYEPSGVGAPGLFQEALSLAHIVKYSHERMAEWGEKMENADGLLLVVETLGREGLRFRSRLAGHRGRKVTKIEAFPVKDVQDSAGAGDWCTAGLIHRLGQEGLTGFLRTDSSQLMEALRFGQALAAWNCLFEGARGGMYQVTLDQFQSTVREILKGADPLTARSGQNRRPAAGSQGFACASCRNPGP